MAKELNVSDGVLFTGNVPRRRVYSLLARIDVFVVSSRWEGFCNAMVEAMVAGKAVVASRVGPLPEVLGEDCGLFFDTGNEKELCRALERICITPSLRKELGEKARLRAIGCFGLDRCARHYEKIYENLSCKGG